MTDTKPEQLMTPVVWYLCYNRAQRRNDIKPVEVIRETQHRLVLAPTASGRRSRQVWKSTTYETYYATLAEAEAVVDGNARRSAETAQRKRLRNAAPDLLAALKDLIHAAEALEVHAPCVDGIGRLDDAVEQARTVIKAAKALDPPAQGGPND